MKKGFTLAEVLITLMVIGVVAVITIPALVHSVNDYVLAKQRTVFERKFEEGLKQMRVDGKHEQQYESTEAFVNEMRKYLKIAQVCDKNNLSNCFSEKFAYDENVIYKIVYGQKDENGERQSVEDTEAVKLDFTTSDLKTNAAISNITKVKAKYESDVLGLVFSDGTQMLLTYNPNCTGIESGDTQGNTKKCFGYFADVNSQKSPNLITKDIITNIQLEDLGFEIMEIANPSKTACPSAAYDGTNSSSYCYLTKEQETNEVVSKYILNKPTPYNEDYWGGAMKYCIDKGYKLLDARQLNQLAKAMKYNTNCKSIDMYRNQPRYNDCSDIERTILKSQVGIWSSVPDTFELSFARRFIQYSDYLGSNRNYQWYYVVCIK